MAKSTDINVNTNLVRTVAGNIRSINDSITNTYEANAVREIYELSGFWKGKAYQNAVRKFYKINSTYKERRKDVVEQYVKFLENQVGLGYDETESSNTKLADYFK